MDELRKADDQADTYSDILNYVDRENEIGERRETEKKLLAKHGRDWKTYLCVKEEDRENGDHQTRKFRPLTEEVVRGHHKRL